MDREAKFALGLPVHCVIQRQEITKKQKLFE